MENLYSKASLVLTPQMVETGKVYSMKPEDRKGDFTFSRSTYATRVGPTGLIEKETGNLLTYSNTFSSWGQTSVSVTSGQSGYDGSSDAWLLTTSAVAGYINRAVVNSGVQTFSIYAKAGTETGLFIRLNGGNNPRCFFDLTNGLVGSDSGGVVKAFIEDVGSGWYRCSIVCNDSSTDARVYVANSGGSFPSTGSIYIQDAQVEQGLVARDAITTTTTAIYGGITDNVPRVDYTDSSCPALLLEPQRTNTYISSEWILNLDADLSQEVSDVDSPIENTPFLKITKNTSGLSRQLLYTSTNGDIDTCSVFAKKGSTGGNQIYFSDSFNGSSTMAASFDLDTGSWFVPPSGTALVDYGFENFGNGIYRIWVAGKTMDSANPDSTSWRTPALFLDNGQLAVGEHIYITGLQTERNCSYPTSYIPTYGSVVTRNVDFATKTSASDLIGQTEGSAYLEIKEFIPQPTGNIGAILSLHDGDSLDRIGIIHLSNTTQIQVYVITGGATQVLYNFTPSSGVNKIAIGYANNDIAIAVNGTIAYTDSSATIPATSAIGLNTYGFTNIHANDSINQVLLFKERLSNTDLATITTI